MKVTAKGARGKKALNEIAKNIKLLLLDVDGVMTDSRIILDNDGNEYKCFHVRDGHGIKMLRKAGIPVAIITGRKSKVVEHRARELGITDVFQRCLKKTVAYESLLKKYSITDKEVAYIGDDIVDAPIMKRAGLSIAVADADEHAKNYASMITRNRGGRGAIREVTDLLLRTKGLWKKMIDEYFKV